MPRKSLKERIGLVNANPTPDDPQVEFTIPDSDRGRQLVQDMATGFASAQTLLAERNMYRDASHKKHREVVYTRNAKNRAEGEATYWRDLACNWNNANGQLDARLRQAGEMMVAHRAQADATFASILNQAQALLTAQYRETETLFAAVASLMHEVQEANDQIPKPAPMPDAPDDEGYPIPLPEMERATAALYDATNQPSTTSSTTLTLTQHGNGGAPEPTLDEIAALASRFAPSEEDENGERIV